MRLEDADHEATEGENGTAPAQGPDAPGTVTRYVDVDAPADEVWDLVTDPERRSLWLDDEDALRRGSTAVRVDRGRSISWTWWHPGQDSSPSHVEITLAPVERGTRVTVTEQVLTPRPVMRASAAARTGSASLGATAWDRRLLGLELVLLARGVSLCPVS